MNGIKLLFGIDQYAPQYISCAVVFFQYFDVFGEACGHNMMLIDNTNLRINYPEFEVVKLAHVFFVFKQIFCELETRNKTTN